ncbi:hypothetical protein PVAND_008077 [Polypedilum vanderplanki]|uniref:Uncharacterized protein n=1 Tax=Polypedilum vanderplanki TaxID=319348 RepID=A0A9J6C8P3_POLVA|nr:hypothetical protein PVAND_008077 [Polypedilum vanderplanki]
MQNKFIAEQQQLKQMKPLCPKKPKKLSEKWLKQETFQNKNDTDLLREIDDSLDGNAKGFLLKKASTMIEAPPNPLPYRIAPKFKATFPTGIWSEQNRSEDSLEKKLDSPPPPVWSPKSAPASPTVERKFRPVPFESPTLQRKKHPSIESPSPPPWNQPDYQDKPYQPSIIKSSSLSTISAPRIKQPNHIVFKKARADQFNEKFDKGITLSPKDKSVTFKTASLKPSKSNELVYSIKQNSETKDSNNNNNNNFIKTQEITTTRKMTTQQQQSPKKVDGVGPISKEGIPLSLRSEVTDESREQWYKKMYNTIHKAKDDENYVTVKYKTRRGIPYKSNGYASEPDANYDSDYVIKYSSGSNNLDRQRTLSASNQSEERYGSIEQPVKPNACQYKNQPGRIENYTPGKSSVSDKEAKQHLEQQKLASNYTQGNLSRALKDQGYQSDSTLVFKKKSDVEQLSPVQQKIAYKSFQHGGEVPLHGFRKQAPEKPKDECEDAEQANLDGVQSQKKIPRDERAIINSEIICYPITNITRPLDMFGPFPKSVKSFVPVVPPQPPNRKSSRTNSTLKIVTHWNKSPRSKSSAKHDSMNVKFTTSSNSKKSTELNRSRSAGPSFISTFVSARNSEEKNSMAKRICYRASSSSPIGRKLIHERKASQSPVAFGRGISKERAFAVEKKKVEEKLAKISKDLHVSTRILRNPQLRSPNEVKQAVQNTIRPIAFVKDPKLASLMVKKSLEGQRSYQQSKKSEQKSLKVTVAISTRGREILRTSETVPRNLRQPSNVSTLSSKSSSLTKSAASDNTIKNKLKVKSKGSNVMSSTNSLARTNSTYSIDSSNSKKKTPTDLKIVKNAPITITSQKLKKPAALEKKKIEKRAKTFQDSTLDDNRKAVEGADETLINSNENLMRQESFFQNLFLRDNIRKYGAPINPSSSVLEKARIWNALASYKSEPSLRQSAGGNYLHQSRPVSHSKFREFEKRNESEECYAIFNRPINEGERLSTRGGFVMEQIYKYDSLYQLSDEDEFGNSNRGRSLDFSYSYHERSNSEPPNKTTVMTELVRPYSPLIIYGRNKSVETEKRQRTSRSPSCRRIQSVKTNKLLELSSYQKEIVRAQSVGRTDRVKEKLFEKSINEADDNSMYRSRSLNILNYERHLPICGHKKNERFRDLKEFYSCLERIGQLECATSNSDLPPRRRNEEIIDYDLWQKVREYEKNERELNILVKKLRAEQRDKDFLFQPHTADEVRWRPNVDLGLMTKDKSVENLKEIFQQENNDDVDYGEKIEPSEAKKQKKKKKEKGIFDSTKDNYKPLWRASSVLDLATSMIQKYNKSKKNTAGTTSKPENDKQEKNLGLSRKLLSTLSKDQLKKIKSQLTEIYSSSNENKSGGETVTNIESYVVTVPASSSNVQSDKSFLTVRSHSELTKDQVQEPSVDITTLKNVFESKSPPVVLPSVAISETVKRSISQSLSQELKDKFTSKKQKNPDIERVKKIESSPIKTLPTPKKDISFSFHEAPPAVTKYLADSLPTAAKKLAQPANETESISSETSNRTVIFRDCGTSMDDVQNKIKYFEEIEKDKEKVETTIYHARDDSSPDEEEDAKNKESAVSTTVASKEEKVATTAAIPPRKTLSQSFTDLKDLFGERPLLKSNTTLRSSNENIGESRSLLMKRSRSTSPDSERCYKSLIEFGDVEKLKMKFENYSMTSADDESSCHYIFSDSELNKASSVKQKTRIRGHEYGNVSHITHKYEMQSKRARSRTRRASPILKHSLRKDDILMPHINVISKTASLKDRQKISISNKDSLNKIEPIASSTGEVVAKIKHKFETLDSNLSLMGKMYTSVPDFRELNEISPHLSHLPYCGDFTTHQYPRPEDNNRSINSPDKRVSGIKPLRKRPSSVSPITNRKDHITNVTKQLREIFSDDQSDTRSRNRYLPDRQLADEYLWQKKHIKSSSSSVSFKDIDTFTHSPTTPPLVPIKHNYNLSGYFSDSQKKYVENDVNIHYKVPVRYEFKHAIPDDELARQQAEHMKKVYQEERRRKYLQELQDMSNRRHTDNFTPSQKSPIALNRYDDFACEPPSKSPVNLPGTVARALYSFQGQSNRELSFKKGDIIYIRRQIDKNWYEGEHNAMIGLLPVQYVDIISNDGIRPPIRKPTEGQARAKYNFVAQSDIELSLNKGELVSLTRRVDANWFEGRIGARKGIFPVSYVDVLTDIGSEDLENNLVTTTTTTVTKSFIPSTPSPISFSPNSDIVRETKTIRKTEVLHVDTANEPITYRAMYNYRPVNSDELELREGDLIYVLEQCDDGWFVGTNSRNGFFGTFPGNYVKRVY